MFFVLYIFRVVLMRVFRRLGNKIYCEKMENYEEKLFKIYCLFCIGYEILYFVYIIFLNI